MSHSHDKKGKKHHHHHHHKDKKSVVPPKKNRHGKHEKKHKPEAGTRRASSATKLNVFGLKFDVNGSKRGLKKETSAVEGISIRPAVALSDTNQAVNNLISEQPSTPTVKIKMEPSVGIKSDPEKKEKEPRAGSPTTVPPSPSPVTVAPPPVMAPIQKWKAEEVALGYVEKLDSAMVRLEYVEACSQTQVDIDQNCQIWKKHLFKNQSDAYPITDATLVKVPMQPEDFYVNMSSIIVPHVQHPVLMAQIPRKGMEEEFWRATFSESVVMMYVLMGSDDEKTCDFFPATNGAYINYGAMFVNIRGVEKLDDERTRYTIEILPNGMSNSNMVNVYVHTGWEPHGVPVKYANTTRSVVDVMNFVKTSSGTDKLMVVSRNGVGRAGFFLSLGAAFCCLNDLSEPRIVEIVKAIRLQRPNAVDSMKQYSSLYLCVLYYIKKKTTIPDSLKQKLEDVTRALESIIREDLSIMY